MKSLIILYALLISTIAYSYPLGFKATSLTTKYPALVDFGFLKATSSGSTTTVSSLGAAIGDSLVLGGTINANAILDAQSTTKAFMPPRMTTTQKNAIASPAAGMQVFDTTLNSMSYYDGTAWGFGVGNLLLDNVYSAQVTTTSGALVNLNKAGWISGCTAANPTVCTLSGFTVAPNCSATVSTNTNGVATISSISSTSITIWTVASSSGAAQASDLTQLICQKSGIDYTNSSSSVFTGASANTDWAACTFSTLAWQGLGTVTNTSLQCRRSGGMLEMKGTVTLGTTAASLAQFPLPSNYGAITTSSTTANESYGLLLRNVSGAGSQVYNTLSTVGLGYFQAGNANTGNNPSTATNGSGMFSSSDVLQFVNVRIPISGWSNLSQVVANISGYAQVPGVAGSANPNVDTFTVSYGTTNTATVCSGSPCFIDQIGTGVSSITRTSAGTYVLNTVRSYTKLRCTGNAGYLGGGLRGVVTAYVPSSPSSTVNFETVAASTGNNLTDSYGTLNCMGSY
jgi:hypothetical protein